MRLCEIKVCMYALLCIRFVQLLNECYETRFYVLRILIEPSIVRKIALISFSLILKRRVYERMKVRTAFQLHMCAYFCRSVCQHKSLLQIKEERKTTVSY